MKGMTSSYPQHSFDEMLATITKTFAIAHEKDSDEHLAQALVYNASRLAWRMREQGLSVEEKTSISDVVTDADRAAEAFVAGVLEALRPEDGVLGEEGAQREGTSGRTWVIDPIDGTFNFTSGSDYFCAALALVEGNPEDPAAIRFGAVHRPAMGYTWFGGTGIPTTRDGKEVAQLGGAPLPATCLSTYIHPTFLAEQPVRDAWTAVASQAASLRMLGSGSIDLASVADGSLGAWMQHSVPAWDWLPGVALVLGAGGASARVEAGGKTWSIAGSAQAVEDITKILEA